MTIDINTSAELSACMYSYVCMYSGTALSLDSAPPFQKLALYGKDIGYGIYIKGI
jgi:hypothetical protein